MIGDGTWEGAPHARHETPRVHHAAQPRATRHLFKKAAPAARTTRGALSTIKLTLPLEPAGAGDH